jgi:hypothetical protein
VTPARAQQPPGGRAARDCFALLRVAEARDRNGDVPFAPVIVELAIAFVAKA